MHARVKGPGPVRSAESRENLLRRRGAGWGLIVWWKKGVGSTGLSVELAAEGVRKTPLTRASPAPAALESLPLKTYPLTARERLEKPERRESSVATVELRLRPIGDAVCERQVVRASAGRDFIYIYLEPYVARSLVGLLCAMAERSLVSTEPGLSANGRMHSKRRGGLRRRGECRWSYPPPPIPRTTCVWPKIHIASRKAKGNPQCHPPAGRPVFEKGTSQAHPPPIGRTQIGLGPLATQINMYRQLSPIPASRGL